MNLNEIRALDEQYYMNTFGKRLPVAFDHGQGVTLYDTEGRAYTDFFAGIAVNALGYNHPAVTKAIVEQAGKVCHTSNLYYIEPQAKLAKLLCENSFADKVFLGNSGAEANEGAMKLAVKYFYEKGEDRYEILTARNSFHGRTLATIAATGQEKYQKPYAKLLPACVRNVPFGDLAALRAAATPHTAAVMLEVIQAEGGVIVGEADYIQGVRALCDELGLLLIVDEVQTGMGRCGALFAHELYGIVPDIMTLAKALGGGVTIDLIHEWDYLVDLFGVPETICNIRGKYSDLEIDSDDLSIYIAQYPTLLAEVHLDYFGRTYRRSIELFCKDGSCVADFGAGTLTLPNGTVEHYEEDVNERYLREMNYFLDYAAGEETESLNPPATALQVLKLTLGEQQ